MIRTLILIFMLVLMIFVSHKSVMAWAVFIAAAAYWSATRRRS